MRRQLSHQAWIVLAAAVIFFTNLGATGLWDKDETLYASCAREMYQTGNWVVPTFNGELFPDKPPLMYWLMMSGYRLFGINEIAVRFWSAVLGVGTALATYHLGRLLFRPKVGLWAGLIVSSSIIFTVSARAATVDSALTFAATLAMLAFVVGIRGHWRNEEATPAGRSDDSPPTPAMPSTSWIAFALMYAAMGVAILAKGPVGVILPAGAVGLFLLLTTGKALVVKRTAEMPPGVAARWMRPLVGFLRLLTPRNLLRTVWHMRPATAVVAIAVIAVPWFVLVGLRTEGAWLDKFFGEQNFGRALKPMQGHGGFVFYYLVAILVGFFPWSVFIIPSTMESAKRIRQRHAWSKPYIFVVCWIAVYVVFWTLVSTKLPHYVLPAYPALALLTAAYVDGWINAAPGTGRGWGRYAAINLIVVGAGILIAIPIVTSIYLPGEWSLGLVGLVLAAGGAIGLVCIELQRRRAAMAVFAVTSVVFLTAVFGFAASRVYPYQNAEPLLAEIDQANPRQADLAAFGYFKESYVFYAGRKVPHYQEPGGLRQFLGDAERPYIITSDEYEQAIEQHFPGELCVFARRPRFLRKGEVVVLTRRPRGGAMAVAAGNRGTPERDGNLRR